jgi:poly(A) polymerase
VTIRRLFSRFLSGKFKPGEARKYGPADHPIRRTQLSRGALEVTRKLHEAGFKAFVVGGAVRDLLLGIEPKDFDVATDARPEQVKPLFRRAFVIGRRFRLVHVHIGPETIEVSTFRAAQTGEDATDEHGRLITDNVYGSQAEDALRRDFTINALFLDPLTGDVVDFIGGQADVRAGIIRAIGDARARIAEDRLRMLRAVRLAARLGFTIEPATLDAIRAAASTVTDMASERIGDEVVKSLTEGEARRGFELLAETGLLAAVLPEISRMQGVAQSPDYHPEGDVFRHTLLAIEQLPAGAAETLALGLLFHDVGKPLTAGRRDDRITFYGHSAVGADLAVAICQRLRRSRATWERVDYLVRNHLRLVDAPEMRLSTLKRMLAHDGFDELLALARMDARASNGDLRYVEFCEQRRAELAHEDIRPPRLLGGHDLIALGHPPGPRLGEILRALEEAQLEGQVTSREEAEQFVRARFPS